MSVVLSAKIQIPYQRFSDANSQLYDIEPIDYFFAKEMTNVLLFRALKNSDVKLDVDVSFHLFIALSESLRQGHTCLVLRNLANSRLGFKCDEQQVVTHHGYIFPCEDELCDLLEGLDISFANKQPLVFDNNRLFLRRYYNFEQQVANFISGKTAIANPDVNSGKIRDCLNKLFPAENCAIDEVDWQKVSVANALNKAFSIIAGGPGTGKTYTVTKLLAALVMLSQAPLKIALVAPTGKAAQRLSESISNAVLGFKELIEPKVLVQIPELAQTIHRLLGVIPNSPNFKHCQENLLSIDVLLIDEVSMVDLPLMARITRALPPQCKVILLGDADQLPSVAAGSVLADLSPNKSAIYSKKNANYLAEVTGYKGLKSSNKTYVDHVTFLTKSRRFDGKGEIGQLASAVINGDNQLSWQILQKAQELAEQQSNHSQLHWLASENNDWLSRLVQTYYKPLKHQDSLADAFRLLARFRILCATRVGTTGVEKLNILIENILLGHHASRAVSQSITSNDQQSLYHAKPIMISENDYRLGLYNGDIGLIWKNSAGHLMAVFEKENGEYMSVIPSRLPSFETVYAMTIHKTQGSEFEHVAMILPNQSDNQLLSRELLYTGITRAKQKLTIHSNKAVWFHGVEAQVNRNSGLSI